MYTLRLFKDKGKTNRMQIFLGGVYTVKGVSEEDEKIGIKCRVFAESSSVPDDGIAVHNDDHAFIMMPSGETFETINKPKN